MLRTPYSMVAITSGPGVQKAVARTPNTVDLPSRLSFGKMTPVYEGPPRIGRSCAEAVRTGDMTPGAQPTLMKIAAKLKRSTGQKPISFIAVSNCGSFTYLLNESSVLGFG